METSDVVVVGAGPAGLMLAGELARAGRSVTVLEKHPAPSSLSRAFAVHARTLEILDSRGLAEELVATGATTPGVALGGNGRFDLGRLDSPFSFVLVTPQVNVDHQLERYARSQGAQIVRSTTVTSLVQDDEGVTVIARTGAGEQTWKASYVVGADGAHSFVRDAVGQPFPGEAVLKSIVLADVFLTDPPKDLITMNAVGDCFAFLAPFGDGWFRVMVWDRHHQVGIEAPLEQDEVRDVLHRAMGTDFGMGEVRWMSRFNSDERQVPAYRNGRVFLVGDAAHVHSPAGGQGMNTGIQDAANLGWKLASVLSGAGDDVLDTYPAERHPVGKLVLRSSGSMIRMMIIRPWALRTLRNALLRIISRVPFLEDKVVGIISGVGLRYRRRPGDHDLVGTRAGDLPLREGRLLAAQRSQGFVLVLESDAEPTGSVESLGDLRPVHRTDTGPALLVRPDGYVAWAGRSADGAWRSAWERWNGRTRSDHRNIEA